MRPRQRKAIVVGGSLAGLFAANLLSRRGWEVLVLERIADTLEARGAGIATHYELFRALRKAGVEVDDSIGVKVEGRLAFDKSGRQIAQIPYPQLLTSWSLLYRRLYEVLPSGCYRRGATVAEVRDDKEQPSVTLEDGATFSADLIIGADGIRSSVRRAVEPDLGPSYAGYVAWRGLSPEGMFPDAFIDRFFRSFNFVILDHEQFVCYPVAGEDGDVRKGRRRYNFLWYRPVDQQHELPDLLRDDDGMINVGGIRPDRIRKSHLDALRLSAEHRLPEVFASIVRSVRAPFLQPIYDLSSSRLSSGRVVLVGDAAFVARPHVGGGVTKAAGDALALADALVKEPDITSALAMYENARLSVGREIVAEGRELGAYLEGRGADIPQALPAHTVLRRVAMPLSA